METTANGEVGTASRCDEIDIKEEPELEIPDEPDVDDPVHIKQEFLQAPLKCLVPRFHIKQEQKLKPDYDGSEQKELQCGWFGWEKQETQRDVREHTNDWETECPPEICISNTNIEGDLQETTILDDGIKLEVPHGRNPQDPLQLKEEILEDPVKMEMPSLHMKQDPELSHAVDGSEHSVVCSTTYASTCTRLKQNTGGSNDISLNGTVHQATGRAELEMGAEKSTHSTVSGTGLLSQEDSSFCSRHKCRLMETEFRELSCSFCLQRFPSKYRLIMHVFSHISGVRPPAYICKSCGEVLSCNVSMIKHTRVSKGYRVLSADNEKLKSSDDCERNICLEVDQEGAIADLIEKKSLNQSSAAYATEKPHRSDNYGNLSTAGDVKTHAGLFTIDKPYKCVKCGKSFLQLVNLNRHALIHIQQKSYKCHRCGKSFTQLGNLKTHLLIHTGRKPYKCEVCSKSFNVASNLKTHALIHTKKKPYKCDSCGKSFTQLGSLKKHTLIHTGTKPYKCVSCGKAFTRLDSLNRHTLIHTGMKPYKCKVCSKSFTQASDLKTHILIHTGRKPYKCDSCDKSFTQLHNLKTHILTHTGTKPCKCVRCGKTFTQSNSLKRHMLIHTRTKS